MMKKIILLFLIISLSSCGYTSVFKYQKQDMNIIVKEMEGDFEINNFIKNDLKISSNKSSENIFEVNLKSEYEKNVLVKDSAGKATDYNLDLTIKFLITSEQKQEIVFKESFKIKNNDEKFEMSNYEKEIKRNFSKAVKDKLFVQLLKINDN